MMLYDSMLRMGLYLRRHKNIFPYLFVASMIVAVLITRDINVNPTTTLSTLICIMIASLSIIIRWLALRTDGERMPQFIEAKGIYSILRHPIYVSNFLMVFSLSLYLGITWYVVFISFVSVFITERIVFQKENCQYHKYGEAFTAWSKTSGAVFPYLLNWQNAANSRSYVFTAGKISGFMLASATVFMCISIAKDLVIEKVFSMPIGWSIGFIVCAILFVLLRVNKKLK